MKKKFLLLPVLLTLSAFLVTPVLAPAPATYYLSGASCRVIVQHGPYTLMIEALNIKKSTPIPPHDLLLIFMYCPESKAFLPWVVVTDNAKCAALDKAMFSWSPCLNVFLVREKELQVWSWFKVELNVPLKKVTLPGEDDTTMIHPFQIRLKTEGPGEWIKETLNFPNCYTINVKAKSYAATATLTGPCGCEMADLEAWAFRKVEMTINAPK